MQQTEEENTKPPIAPTEPISEPLAPLAVDAVQPAEDDDSPDAIFVRAVTEIPTQPLNRSFTPQWALDRKLARECTFTLVLFLSALIATVIVRIINQPLVTVAIVPMQKHVQLTTAITIQTRSLAPVTINKTLTAPTTGKGHQQAKQARGTLAFYNGLFTMQTFPQGTVFTGADGIKVTTDKSVTIPAGNPPSYGQATIPAHAIMLGAAGNIQAGDISTSVSNGVLVKSSQFSGGRDARDFHAVAKSDLDSLTATLQQQLTQAMPQTFNIAPGEEVTPTNCTFTESADHGAGDEAKAVTVQASKTCSAVAYKQETLQQQATAAFTTARPGKQYERVGSVHTTVVSIVPFIVRLTGLWEYALTPDDEQDLAQHIQGDTPQQARASLFKTGLVSQVTIAKTQSLPDFYHIKFLILIGV